MPSWVSTFTRCWQLKNALSSISSTDLTMMAWLTCRVDKNIPFVAYFKELGLPCAHKYIIRFICVVRHDRSADWSAAASQCLWSLGYVAVLASCFSLCLLVDAPFDACVANRIEKPISNTSNVILDRNRYFWPQHPAKSCWVAENLAYYANIGQ